MTRKKKISPEWKNQYNAISIAERTKLGINRNNFRVEFSKELDHVKRHK
jgi:hypothetical protein